MFSDYSRKRLEEPYLKILVLSGTNAGKSCLLSKYQMNEFSDNYTETIGIDYRDKQVSIEKQLKLIRFIEIPSAERFYTSGLRLLEQQILQGVFFVIDGSIFIQKFLEVRNSVRKTQGLLRDEFFELTDRLDKDHIRQNLPLTVFINKMDLVESEFISKIDEMKKHIHEYFSTFAFSSVEIFHGSAKTSEKADIKCAFKSCYLKAHFNKMLNPLTQERAIRSENTIRLGESETHLKNKRGCC